MSDFSPKAEKNLVDADEFQAYLVYDCVFY